MCCSWFNLISELIYRFEYTVDPINTAIKDLLKEYRIPEELLEAKDEELVGVREDMKRLFDLVNQKSNGIFYKGFEWYVERDILGRLHMHVIEKNNS